MTRDQRLRIHASLATASLAASCMLLKPLEPAESSASGGNTAGGVTASGGSVLSSKGGVSAAGAGNGGATGTGGSSSAAGGRGGSSAGGASAGEAGGGEGGSPGVPTPECSKNADCNREANPPSFCQLSTQRCVQLTSDSCRVSGDASNARALFFGAFAPFSVSPAANTIRDTYDLAMLEFAQVQGLPTSAGRRPLVMVLCDNEGGPSVVDAGMRHLIQDVGVPAILAAVPSADLQRNFESDYGGNTFYLTPQKVSEELANADSEGLIWNLLGRSSDLVGIYAAVLRQFEAYFRSIHPEVDTLRVAAVTQLNDPDENELSLAVLPALRFNAGASWGDNTDAGNALVVDESNGDVINKVIAFKPHLVISFVRERFTQLNGIAHQLDKGLIDKPYHLLGPFNSADEGSLRDLFDAETRASFTDPQRRYLGIDGPSALDAGSRDAKNEYESRLLSLHASDAKGFENFYDAFYYLIYAMYAGGFPVTSLGTARGMKRLYEGTEKAYVGPSGISDTFAQLQTRESIYLMGALGAPSFDVTGGRVDTGSVYCFDNLAPPSLRPSVFGYDPKTDQLFANLPSLPCFSGFLSVSANSLAN